MFGRFLHSLLTDWPLNTKSLPPSLLSSVLLSRCKSTLFLAFVIQLFTIQTVLLYLSLVICFCALYALFSALQLSYEFSSLSLFRMAFCCIYLPRLPGKTVFILLGGCPLCSASSLLAYKIVQCVSWWCCQTQWGWYEQVCSLWAEWAVSRCVPYDGKVGFKQWQLR